MKLYWVKTNRLIKRIFPKYIWDIPSAPNTVYLTFDDGPEPEITPWVLDILKQHNIKATFFCIGDNIRKHPEVFKKVIADGHAIGNHTFSHLNGWKTKNEDYLENAGLCEIMIAEHTEAGAQIARLFRPPYGKVKSAQAQKLLDSGYKIIMWDVLSADFDQSISKENCLENATAATVSGSIIIFHDSIRAFRNLEYALPKTIEILKEKGFRFGKIA